MRNAMQLKALIKNIALRKHIAPQLVMQNYMLERLLERISLSKYQPIFILKGGFLIAAMVGWDTRSTMDMDATLKGFPVKEETVRDMFLDIISVNVDDSIVFSFESVEEIREGDEYTGYRVHIKANFQKMAVPLKLDITTGDIITPREVEFVYKSSFEDKKINILAYNKETILAEKLETIISRGDQNTRPRDFYDVFILSKLFVDQIDKSVLRESLEKTAVKRGSLSLMSNFLSISETILQSEEMQKQWAKFSNNYNYANNLSLADVLNSVVEIMSWLNGYRQFN